MSSPEFVSLFENDAPYQEKLDAKLLLTYEHVEQKIAQFKVRHQEEEQKMLDQLLSDFISTLKKKEKDNKGFPDTPAMRTALFGQIAFAYE